MIISLARERSIATIGGNAYILAAQSEANLRLVTAASLRNLLEIQTLETNSRPALHPDLVIRNLHFYQDPLAIWTYIKAREISIYVTSSSIIILVLNFQDCALRWVVRKSAPLHWVMKIVSISKLLRESYYIMEATHRKKEIETKSAYKFKVTQEHPSITHKEVG